MPTTSPTLGQFVIQRCLELQDRARAVIARSAGRERELNLLHLERGQELESFAHFHHRDPVALRMLAAQFDDHPDYDSRWRL